jgi:asparagine synthase (glutamine-hydrolysing)
MCGILLLHGPNAIDRLPKGLARLRHRGPDDERSWLGNNIALGFTRLEINGKKDFGRQPYSYGNLIGAFNGEIYNYRELASSLELSLSSKCDTHVLLHLFETLGPCVIDKLDGFYSGVVIDQETGELFCLRDHVGKKPLFFGRSRGELFITSELKALDDIDWFEILPKGVTRIDLEKDRLVPLMQHQQIERRQETILQLMTESVSKRLPHLGEPVGLFLSGGLDSSIIAALASQIREDIIYYTLAGPNSSDLHAVKILAEELGLKKVRIISLPPAAQIPDLIQRVVYATESFNPSMISNGLATYLLADAAHRDGIKVVLTGEGADELFGGYHSFRENDTWRETREDLIEDMHFTELRRLDLCSMAHGVEPRCPFLDRSVQTFSDNLGYRDLYDGTQNKVTLRREFEGLLPDIILNRPKTSFDVGSGIRRQVVSYLRRNGRSERKELNILWKQQFIFDDSKDYFHRYPVFDQVIDRRGEEHRCA